MSMLRNRRLTHRPNQAFIDRFQAVYGDIVDSSTTSKEHGASASDDNTVAFPNTGNDTQSSSQARSNPFRRKRDSSELTPQPERNLQPKIDRIAHVEPVFRESKTSVQSQREALNADGYSSSPVPFSYLLNEPFLDFNGLPIHNENLHLNNINTFYSSSPSHAIDTVPLSLENHGANTRHSPSSAIARDLVSLPNLESSIAQETNLVNQPNARDDRARFYMVLHASTAMIREKNEAPMTYLNRGKIYLLSVVDKARPTMHTQNIIYRTSIRVLFGEGEQRSDPVAYWEIWKRNRGSSKGYNRTGNYQAIEYVDPTEVINGDGQQQMGLESTALNGFTVTCEVKPTSSNCDASGRVEYIIPIRLNILSTDFSFSKGVKGIPLRLYAKSEPVEPTVLDSHTTGNKWEARFCNIKIFRDHGAERKLANDMARVNAKIREIQEKISDIELGGFDLRGRESFSHDGRRSTRLGRPAISQQVPSYQRMKNELYRKMAVLRDMLASTLSVSPLYLSADEEDDVGLCLLSLSLLNDQRAAEADKAIHRKPRRSQSQPLLHPAALSSDIGASFGQGRPSNLERDPFGDFLGSQWDTQGSSYDGMDIDPCFKSPRRTAPHHSSMARSQRPAMCLYIRFEEDDDQDNMIYRVIYLPERTVQALREKIAQKRQIDTGRISRVVTLKKNALKVLVDDEFVQEMPNEQDVAIRVSEIPSADGDGGPVLFEAIMSYE